MKRKILLAGILAAMMISQSAFADISLPEGVLDREFNEARTLYYVEIPTDSIPDITAEGYEVVKKAAKPYSGGALTEENTTVLKNLQTGVRYRFVFEKKGGKVEVSGLDLTTSGALTINGSAENLNNVKIFILKPTEEFSNTAFTYSDVDESAMEKTVLDMLEIPAANIKDGVIAKYNFPSSAGSGMYGFLVTADGISGDYYTTKFYMSNNDITDIIAEVNEKSQFDETNTAAKLREYVEEKSNLLYLDMTNYNKLSNGAKNIAISCMESEGDYTTLDEIGKAFYKGVAVAWIHDGLSVSEILSQYNQYLELEMYENYNSLSDKSKVNSAVKGCEDEESLRKTFNNMTSVSIINEADPAGIKEVIEKYNVYLDLDEELYNYFIDNSSKCVKALANKGFNSSDEIEKAIEEIKNPSSNPSKPSGGPSGGISSNLPAKDTNYVAPITEQKPETPPEQPDKNETKLPFEDIANVGWAHTAIEHLYNNKILNGKSETVFAPNDYVTREEFVKLIVNGFSLDKTGSIEFSDVDDDAWYSEFVKIAFNSGVINGISENEFGVGKNITREDMAVMIYRAVQATGMDVDIIIENPAELSDLDQVSDYALEAVEFMIEKGAINGIDGKFMPSANATRAQTAQMLYQIIKIR